MTNEFEYLMYLYSCGAKGVSADAPKNDIDYNELYNIADKMSLLSMLSYALKISPQVPCPIEIKARLYEVMLGSSLKNKMRMDAVIKKLNDIENTGIKVAVIKGLDCARYYDRPECRISADTDLLVDKKDEEKLLKYFEQNGYEVHRRTKHQHHSECISKSTGIFEVHAKLWDGSVDDAMMGKTKNLNISVKNSLLVNFSDQKIRVLNQTDAMIFMTMHLVKHFMFSQASLKMAYDLALYYVNNKDAVDTERYKKCINELGFNTIVSAFFSSMVCYCGFGKFDFDAITNYDTTLCEKFVDGLMQFESGSDENMPDLHLLAKYYASNKLTAQKGQHYDFLYNAQKVLSKKVKILFPETDYLAIEYPCLKKHPYLYVPVWFHRLFTRGFKRLFKRGIKADSIFKYKEKMQKRITSAEEERIKTLKDFDLL